MLWPALFLRLLDNRRDHHLLHAIFLHGRYLHQVASQLDGVAGARPAFELADDVSADGVYIAKVQIFGKSSVVREARAADIGHALARKVSPSFTNGLGSAVSNSSSISPTISSSTSSSVTMPSVEPYSSTTTAM